MRARLGSSPLNLFSPGFERKSCRAGGQLRGAGVVSGCLVDERGAPWVFTEANGWTLRLILDIDLDPKGMRVQIAVQRSPGAPLLPLFWFHLDGDPEAHCWRTLPVFVRAISEREFEREDAL